MMDPLSRSRLAQWQYRIQDKLPAETVTISHAFAKGVQSGSLLGALFGLPVALAAPRSTLATQLPSPFLKLVRSSFRGALLGGLAGVGWGVWRLWYASDDTLAEFGLRLLSNNTTKEMDEYYAVGAAVGLAIALPIHAPLLATAAFGGGVATGAWWVTHPHVAETLRVKHKL